MTESLDPADRELLDRLERTQGGHHQARWEYMTIAAALDPAERYAADNAEVDRRHVADALSWRFGAAGAITWRASRIGRVRRGLVLGAGGEMYAEDPGSRFFCVAVPLGVDLGPFVSVVGGRTVGMTFLGPAIVEPVDGRDERGPHAGGQA